MFGQDGAYLSKLLLGKGYEVQGTSRDAEISTFTSLKKLNIYDNIQLYSTSLIDFRSVMQTILEVMPDDFVIATGKSYKLIDFVKGVFEEFNLNYEDYLEIDSNLIRPSEIMISQADVTKAKVKLGWQATKNLNEIIAAIIRYEKNIYTNKIVDSK